MAAIQADDNCSPGAYAKNVIWLPCSLPEEDFETSD